MFLRRKALSASQQIPYPVYETLRETSPRRGRWLVEILLAGGIVILLLLGGTKLYDSLHKTKAPSPTKGSSSTNVVQSPQTNKDTQPNSAPTTTSAGKSTSSSPIAPPSGN